MTDILHEKTEVYRCEARLPSAPRTAFFLILTMAAACAVLLNLAGRAPYGVFLELAVLALTAVGVYAVLKKSVFTVAYVLTSDNMLIYITKYGFLSRETAHIDLNRAVRQGNGIIFENRRYDFYPDKRMEELLSSKK